jgi:hypothetical protein
MCCQRVPGSGLRAVELTVYEALQPRGPGLVTAGGVDAGEGFLGDAEL